MPHSPPSPSGMVAIGNSTEPRSMVVTGDGTYWVRVITGNNIDGHETGHATLAGAVRWADERGFAPTHVRDRSGWVGLIPTGIVRPNRPTIIATGGDS